MARTEDSQESNNSKTLLIDDAEIVDDSAVPESELSIYCVLSTVKFTRIICDSFFVDESVTVKTGCQHISKAVDANNVRKNIRRNNNKNFTSLKCSACKTESSPDVAEKVL